MTDQVPAASHRGWWAGFAVAAAAGTALAYAQATSRPILGARWPLLWLLLAWSVVWVVGVVCALHLPGRRSALVAILVVGTALRVVSFSSGPTLSDDLYRYSWDARVQLSGTDPYRYPPDSRQLVGLREGWLWPDARGCAHIVRGPGCTRINRPAVRTIYPPVAEAWFTASYWLGGGIGDRYKLWQVAGLVTELATLALLAVALAQRGRDRRWVALYALSPFPAVEIVNNGHVDGLAIAFLIAAFVALGTTKPTVRRSVLAGLLIGAATLVKLYPVFALAPLWLAPAIRWRHRLAALAAVLALAIVGYAPHVAAVGIKVIGYLPGYLREEHYTGTSSRFLLVDLLHLPGGHANDVAVAVVLAATIAALAWVRLPALEAASVLFGVCLLCATPVQPWYSVTLLALATVAVRARWAPVVVAGYPYFFAIILASRHAEAIGQISYGTGALIVVVTTIVTHRPAGRGTRRSRSVPSVAVPSG